MAIRGTALYARSAQIGLGAMLALAAAAQSPASPGGERGATGDAVRLLEAVDGGENALRGRDPVHALESFRSALAIDPGHATALVGAGRSHLLLGSPLIALRYARAVLDGSPKHDEATALEIRSLLRARRFREALTRSTAVAEGPDGLRKGVGLATLAAHGSALFRTQNNADSAAVYRRVLVRDPLNSEANLRLGSGLGHAREVEITTELRRGVDAARTGDLDEAIRWFVSGLRTAPSHPIAHRLLGELVDARQFEDSMVARSTEFAWLSSVLPQPALRKLPVDQFMPAYAELVGARREVAARGLALFANQLDRLVTIGGRHDLIYELERTTDHPARSNLRGRRTFDGRVWDDVRGIGGLRAATGIESLDEASRHGFDTLAHEIAHQAHLYSFPRRIRNRIRRLYDRALAEGRCLDFYAASNDAEYFGQAVEAFVSLGKRPGFEVTHGHTRFELMRIDPEVHALIVDLVDLDPLSERAWSAAVRGERLRAAIAVALRAGRPADAVTAAGLLPAGTESRALADSATGAWWTAQSF